MQKKHWECGSRKQQQNKEVVADKQDASKYLCFQQTIE